MEQAYPELDVTIENSVKCDTAVLHLHKNPSHSIKRLLVVCGYKGYLLPIWESAEASGTQKRDLSELSQFGGKGDCGLTSHPSFFLHSA